MDNNIVENLVKDISYLKESLNMNNFTFNHNQNQCDKPESIAQQDSILIRDSIQIQDITDSIINPVTDQLVNLQTTTNSILKENKQ